MTGLSPDAKDHTRSQNAAFDHLLLQHAASSGADVHERHRALDVAFDDQGVTATVQGAEGGPRSVRARAMIDASGPGSLLSRKFGLRIDEPRLANIAVFSHYSGVPRRPDRRVGDIRIVSRDDLSVRRFRRFARRQRQRYLSFRRFVLGFYTQAFRDLFFDEDPPRRMFRSLVTVFCRLLASVPHNARVVLKPNTTNAPDRAI